MTKRDVVIRCLVLSLFGGCSTESTDSGSQTHWLASCTQDADCRSAGVSCVCGVCTKPCSASPDCNGFERDAVCVEPPSPAHAAACAGSESRALCLPSCRTGCATGERCVDSACVRDTVQRLDAGPPGFFDDEGACRTPPPTPVFVCLPGTLPPTQFPVTIPGTVTSIEAGNVCTTALGPGVRGYALNVAAASAPPVRVELSLGPLPLPFQVGDEISLTEYGNAGPQAPGPNYSITKNGEIVVYVSQSEPFNGQPPLPVSLEFGKITCTGAEFCGTVTTYNLSASVGADSVQLGIGESARVGVFDVYSGRVASADPNSKCGDWGPRSFIAAFVRRAILDAGMPPGP